MPSPLRQSNDTREPPRTRTQNAVRAYDVADEIEDSDAGRRDEFDGHPSVRSLVEDGYEVITY